ncbi:MAG TPA: NAD(P)-dependent alcohol dehydrogenase [Terriglobales bacterium]|nr:NAD(P)-dependent alcohol dehydrogenase [Terriglobales bacterium]
MKAIVYREYGAPEVLKLEEVGKPAPGEKDVLIRVRAAAVNPLDWHFMRGLPYLIRLMTGLAKPKDARFGVDVAGEVEATGSGVKALRAGEAVFGTCRGACAEYACGAEVAFVQKPVNVTFEEAAAVSIAGLTALQSLRDKGQVQAGQRVLVNGAAGGVGTFGVQIAKALGAEVTGVCSARNVELVRSIGADHMVDYTREDFTKGGVKYDVILDCVSNHSLAEYKRCMTAEGRHVGAGRLDGSGRWMLGVIGSSLAASAHSLMGRQKFLSIFAKVNQRDLVVLQGLLADEKIKPVIDRRYGLSEVPEAIQYLEQLHARGKVVIEVK